MSSPTNGKGLRTLGGVAFMLSGVLFFARYLLEAAAGRPPATGAEILAWVAANKLTLSFVSEILFFASMALVPAVAALYSALAGRQRVLAVLGCGIIAVVVPVLVALLIVHGRLVYPVYGLRISDPVAAEFALSIYYGGLHAVALLLAAATAVLSFALRGGRFGMPVTVLGFATAAADITWSYPDLISPAVLFGCQVLFAAWFVAVGWKLLGLKEQSLQP